MPRKSIIKLLVQRAEELLIILENVAKVFFCTEVPINKSLIWKTVKIALVAIKICLSFRIKCGENKQAPNVFPLNPLREKLAALVDSTHQQLVNSIDIILSGSVCLVNFYTILIIGTKTRRMGLGIILFSHFSSGACTSMTSTMGMVELV